MKVEFIKEARVNGELVFIPGDVKELSFDSAMRWIKRGIAQELPLVKEIEKVLAKVEAELDVKIEELDKEVIVEENKKEVKSKKKSKGE